MTTEKEVLVAVFTGHLSLLIPRKYRAGFLHRPLVHQHTELAALLIHTGIRAVGEDGSMEIQLSPEQVRALDMDKDNFIARTVMLVAMHYGSYYREVSREEYWDRHPLRLR
jgi:hypothetical protein